MELQDALDRAESKNANQREECFTQSREAEAEARARDEEHANGIKKLTRLVESLQKQRVFPVDQHSYRSPTPPFASEPGTGPERQAPSHPAYEGGVHSPNFPEFYDMTGPPGLHQGPPGTPGPPGRDDNDDDDDDDRKKRSKKDKKSKKKKKKRDSSSDSSSSSDVAAKIAKALKKLAKSKKNKKDESDDEDGTDRDKDKPPKNKPKEAENPNFPCLSSTGIGGFVSARP